MRRLIPGLVGPVLIGLAMPSFASAATTVSGTLKGGKGYTINAVARDGSAASAKLSRNGAFKLRIKAGAKGATLQLIRPNGSYFGPVVLAHKARSASLTLSGKSAKLGSGMLRDGHAVVAAPAAAVGAPTVQADTRGKPRGAGKLGLVRKAKGRAAQSDGRDGEGRRSGGGETSGTDPDGDGVPSPYDADDDGDLVLDGVESSSSDPSAGLFSTLFLNIPSTINANAGSTPAQTDAVIAGENFFNLIFYFDGGQFPRGVTGAHIDCFALVYCRRGDGTAILGGLSESGPSLPRGERWATYTPDGSGYPNLERIDRNGSTAVVAGVQPRVPTSQIRPGDTYNVTFATGDGPLVRPITLAGYFVTVPAVTSYSSGATVGSISYPAAGDTPGASRNTPVALGSDRVTLTFWRPQRLAIPGAETPGYRDQGGLNYGVVAGGEGMTREATCAGLYSGLSPSLIETPSSGVFTDAGDTLLFPLRDTAADSAPDRSNTLSLTVDLGACLRRAGRTSAGANVELTLTAAGAQRNGGQDRAAQTLSVTLPG